MRVLSRLFKGRKPTRLDKLAGALLNLSFVGGATALDSRITFSRASNATVTGPDGLIRYAPHNLLTYSEQFDNAAWTKTNSGTGVLPTVTANAVAAPDGTTTADQIAFSLGGGATSSDWSWITQGYTAISGATYTVSVWLRTASGTATIALDSASNDSNLVTVTSSWQRFSFARTDATGGGRTVRIGLRGNNVASGGSNSATVFFWGAQLEIGSTATAYNPTTVKNLLGYTQEFDNAAWTKSNAFIQTNLLTYSQQFDNAAWTKSNAFVQTNLLTYSQEFDNAAWTKTNATITANSTVAPDGSTTADTAALSAAGPIVRQTFTTSTVSSFTASVWLRSATATSVTISLRPTGAGSPVSVVCSVTDVWQRFQVSITTTSGISALQFWIEQFTQSIDLWGAQLVQSSVAGNYQQTTSAAAAILYTAPDGTLTADKLVEDAANSLHRIGQVSTAVSGSAYTLSAYFKAGEKTTAGISLYDGTTFVGRANFDLTGAGTATVVSGSAGITSIGNGWYRCWVQGTPASASVTSYINAGSVYSYQGDGTSGVYIWGAQLVQGAVIGDYQATTSAAKAVMYAAPDGSLTADKLVENTANSSHYTQQTLTLSVGAYTRSIYVKPAERTIFRLGRGTLVIPSATFNLSTMTVSSLGSGDTGGIQNIGNGWYRCYVTGSVPVAGSCDSAILLADDAGNLTYTGNGTSGIYIWGAQLSDSASLDPYVYNPVAAPTSTAYYGPRFDYAPIADTEVLGSELVTNGDFSNGATGWTVPAGWAISGGQAIASAVSSSLFGGGATTVQNRFYRVEFDVVSYTSGTLYVTLGANYTTPVSLTSITLGRKSILVSAGANTSRGVEFYGGAITATIDNISVKEVTYVSQYTEQLGLELVTNGDFSSSTGWSLASSCVISGGLCTFSSNSTGYTYRTGGASIISGRQYAVTFDVTNYSGTGTIRGYIGNTAVFGPTLAGNGRYTAYITANMTGSAECGVNVSGFNGSIDNFSVKEYTGLKANGTATSKGLLIEEQRTNLVTYSEQFDNAAWTKTESSVTANAALAPDGTITADKLIASTTVGSTHLITQAPTVVSGTTYTFSAYLKAAEYGSVIVGFIGGGGFTTTSAIVVNLATGEISSGLGTLLSSSATRAGNGWWRVAVSLAASASAVGSVYVAVVNGTTYADRLNAGNGTSGIYLWGAQLEAGASATSYIPTVAATVTRAADVASMIGANFSNWFTSPTAYSWYVEHTYLGDLAGAITSIDLGNVAASANDFTATAFAALGIISLSVRSGGVVQASQNYTGLAVNSTYRTAYAVATNSYNSANNGVLGTEDTSVTLPASPNTLSLGSSYNFGSGTLYIKRIAYFPRRLSNSELQSITA